MLMVIICYGYFGVSFVMSFMFYLFDWRLSWRFWWLMTMTVTPWPLTAGILFKKCTRYAPPWYYLLISGDVMNLGWCNKIEGQKFQLLMMMLGWSIAATANAALQRPTTPELHHNVYHVRSSTQRLIVSWWNTVRPSIFSQKEKKTTSGPSFKLFVQNSTIC